jgi:hypothetical protein
VIEQAPPEIDAHIHPSDSVLLLSSLTSLSVSHFEIENGGTGDPRSIAIRWEFGENDYFEDRVIEKRFWYRRARDGWTGLVSEPVDIRWKAGKDLTNGLLGMVKRVWDEEQAAKASGKELDVTEEQKALQKKIENTGISGISFFAWFGYIGQRVSAEASRLAIEKDTNKRKLRAEGKPVDEEDEEEDDGSQDEAEYEIFPDGHDVAVAISEDLWPDAITYFSMFALCRYLPRTYRLTWCLANAQEQDALSDDDFESDDEEAPELVDIDERTLEERPAKKQRT